jgi:hypothetical protein
MERESQAYASWPGLSWRVPAIHVFARRAKDVVGRHKGGHDVWCVALQRFWVLASSWQGDSLTLRYLRDPD